MPGVRALEQFADLFAMNLLAVLIDTPSNDQ